MEKKKLIKTWLKAGDSPAEIERKLDALDQTEDINDPTLQEIQDRNVAVISSVNDKVDVNGLAIQEKKSITDTATDLAALETRMKQYVDDKFSETLTLNFNDGTNEDVKAGK